MTIVDYKQIQTAAKKLAGQSIRTPLLRSIALEQKTGARIWLKAENLQRTGSFKFRGAYNALSNLSTELQERGVVAVSSGNHAQGVAEAGRILGIKSTIIMPEDAPNSKIERTQSSGATLKLYDRYDGDRDQLAESIIADRGGTLIHPFENPFVIAGQGTVGLEIAEDFHRWELEPDIVLVCTGGGGLVAGVTIALKQSFPNAKIYTVEPMEFDDYRRSLEHRKRMSNDRSAGSICDAILTPCPGELSFKICCNQLAGGIAVSDRDAEDAMTYAFEYHRTVVEPGGAVALGAILSGRLEESYGSLAGKKIVAVLSGGNVDADFLYKALKETKLPFSPS